MGWLLRLITKTVIFSFKNPIMRNLFLSVVLLCFGCASPSVVLKQGAKIERLGIYFDFGEQAPPLIAHQFDDKLDDFIARHNADPRRKFEVFRASANDSTTLRIKLVATRMVSPGDQTAGALVSVLGLALPIVLISAEAPIIIFFYYFPRVKSMTELSLSEDINQSNPPVRGYLLVSPGFLMPPEKQVTRHAISFDALLTSLLTQIERQVKTKSGDYYVATRR